ncbi:hypothetical protein FQZ97_884150 [compost metagenome]
MADHVQIIKKISLAKPTLSIEAASDQIASTDNTQALETTTFAEPKTEPDFLIEEDRVEPIPFINEWKEERELQSKVAADENKQELDIRQIEEEVFKPDHEPSTFEFILNEHAEHEKFDFESKSVDEIFDRPLSAEEENILAQKKKINETPNQVPEPDEDEIGPEPFLVTKEIPVEFEPKPSIQPQPESKPEPQSISPAQSKAQTVAEDPAYTPTLNDMLAAKADKKINEQTGAKRVTDLKMAVNLNDKLIYIKDLFNGYNLAYAEAIEIANKLANFEAADQFFQKNYAVKNDWASKQATVDKFYELLNQRFK